MEKTHGSIANALELHLFLITKNVHLCRVSHEPHVIAL